MRIRNAFAVVANGNYPRTKFQDNPNHAGFDSWGVWPALTYTIFNSNLNSF